MNFTIVPAFIINQIFTKPCRFYKGHLEGYDYDHLLFSYHGFQERHIRKTDITKSHCKIDGSCCNTSPAHEFCYRHQCYETTKQVVKLIQERKIQPDISIPSAGDKITPHTDVQVNKMPEKELKKLAVVTPALSLIV
jgi:ferrochelatase